MTIDRSVMPSLPTTSGMYDMNVVTLPDDTNDPMQVVSGANGKAKGHFEAPQADRLADELERFFQ